MNIETQAEIKRRERQFNAASPAEKRVLIAKDVLKQLDAGYIFPSSGRICELSDRIFAGRSEGDGVREAFLEEAGKVGAPSCSCCAVGAMFLSCTLYRNQLSIQEYRTLVTMDRDFAIPLFNAIKTHSPLNGLTEYFSAKQIKLIEIAFERGEGIFQNAYQEGLTEEEVENAVGYRDLFNEGDDDIILREIMNNIIKNKGKFIP